MMKKLLQFGLIVGLVAIFSGCQVSDVVAGDSNSNDTYDKAGTFNADGSEFTGDLGGAFDFMDLLTGQSRFDIDKEDWYKHTASDDGIFAVSYSLVDEPTDSIALSLYDASSLTQAVTTASTATKDAKRNIILFQTKNEQYFFKMSNGENTKKVSYTLKGTETTTLTDVAESTENNGTSSTADTLCSVVTTKITGHLKDDEDTVDYYKFTASDSGIVYVKLAKIASAYNVSLVAHDSNDSAILDTSIDSGSNMSFSVTKDEVYYLKISTTDTTDGGVVDRISYYVTTHFIAN